MGHMCPLSTFSIAIAESREEIIVLKGLTEVFPTMYGENLIVSQKKKKKNKIFCVSIIKLSGGLSVERISCIFLIC